MTRDLGYHLRVRPVVISAFLSLALAPLLRAQINGIPPSVTSIAPGRPNINVAPSVTSLGPNGFQNRRPFPVAPFAVVPNPPRFHHHHHHPVYGYYPVAVPIYYGDYYGDSGQVAPGSLDDTMEEEQYQGGPTIFDRRGPGTPGRAYDGRASRDDVNTSAAAPSAERSSDDSNTPVTDEPGTLLVFKDGQKLEVKNYAIQGDMLYDLTAGHRRKIELAELDLTATQKENENRGVDFELPAGVGGN
jgi:hypothetical protein